MGGKKQGLVVGEPTGVCFDLAILGRSHFFPLLSLAVVGNHLLIVFLTPLRAAYPTRSLPVMMPGARQS